MAYHRQLFTKVPINPTELQNFNAKQYLRYHLLDDEGCLGGSVETNLPANARDADAITEWGGSPGEGSDNPIQYSFLGNPTDGGQVGYSPWGCNRVGHDLTTKQLDDQLFNSQSKDLGKHLPNVRTQVTFAFGMAICILYW